MAFDPISPLYFGYFFKLQNQYPFGSILDCRIRDTESEASATADLIVVPKP